MARVFKTGITADGNISTNGNLISMNSSGDEGGEILLSKPVNTSPFTPISGTGVTIDVWQNRLRFFEQGGSARGFYIDITSGGAGVSTNLVSGGSYTLPTASSTVLGGIKVGTNLSIDGSGVLSSTDTNTTYTFASGTTNGAFSVTPSGSSAQTVAIYGLGSAAYTASGDYATSSHTHGNITNAGAIGSTANRVIVTTTAGALTTATGTSQSSSTYLRGDLTWVTPTDTNWYPTAYAWTGGTTAGPTGSLTGTGMSAVSFGAIPSASSTASGIVTTSAQTFAGSKTFGTFSTPVSSIDIYSTLNVLDGTGVSPGSIYAQTAIESGGSVLAGTNLYAGNVISHSGKSATTTSQDAGVYMNPNGYVLSSRSSGIVYYAHRYGTSGTVPFFQFIYNGTNNGVINIASGGTPAFASGSDYRMKTDITPVSDASERMKNAKAYTFYKINEIDPSDNLHTGFLAHELAEVQPDAVVGEKDAVDENGKPIYQEVMEAKIIPVMAQAINDLIGMVETLTARVELLENK